MFCMKKVYLLAILIFNDLQNHLIEVLMIANPS